MHSFDINIDTITKVEGRAKLNVKVRDSKVVEAKFGIIENKRFFTDAVAGKSYRAAPTILSRICGTCSMAHEMAAIEACEKAVGIVPTKQTMTMRVLCMHALMIRDHALHLYFFSLPDLFGKDSVLDFDESDPTQHKLLHDAFDVKKVGNNMAIAFAGRSIHATYPMVGGFSHVPSEDEVKKLISQLQSIRPKVIDLIKLYAECPFEMNRDTRFVALRAKHYNYLEGSLCDSKGLCIPESEFRAHLEEVVLPYSQAEAFKLDGTEYMVGALSRLNLSRDLLHAETKNDCAKWISMFPSVNIFHNNLAQAIEILHSIDDSIEILSNNKFVKETIVKVESIKEGAVGIGVVEAPRGTLYHKVELDSKGVITNAEVVVPTGQNQLNIEEDIKKLVQEHLTMPKDKIQYEIEKLIRAYDPCMSCSTHFLEIEWDEE